MQVVLEGKLDRKKGGRNFIVDSDVKNLTNMKRGQAVGGRRRGTGNTEILKRRPDQWYNTVATIKEGRGGRASLDSLPNLDRRRLRGERKSGHYRKEMRKRKIRKLQG